MPIAILAIDSYCPVCHPESVEYMQADLQNYCHAGTFDCPVRQLIGQASGLGESFVVYY